MYHFNNDEIWQCYDFARRMIGNHNPDMITPRADWEIFRDDFRGKLGEVGLRNYLYSHMENPTMSAINDDVMPRGKWDKYDLIVNDQIISVKSVKQHSNFLMVEKKRFNPDGSIAYSNHDGTPIHIDLYALVRVTIDKDFTVDDMGYNSVEEILDNRTIGYEVLGGIKFEDFWRKKHFAPEGIACNGQNLNRVCRGEAPDWADPEKDSRNYILQVDNYILNRYELRRVEEILNNACNNQAILYDDNALEDIDIDFS